MGKPLCKTDNIYLVLSLFSISKSNCVIQNQNVLFKLKRAKMSVSH